MTDLSKFKSSGKFLMLALDHRESFKKLMNPDNPEVVTDKSAVQLKKEIIESLEDQFSGLLIDVDYGLKAYQRKTKPFLLPMEKTGYTEENGERLTQQEYFACQLKELGASGAKLLLYFNPYVRSLEQQTDLAVQITAECKLEELPFFLEIVTYEPRGVVEDRADLVLGSLRMLTSLGDVAPSVWKLEYPGSVQACKEVTEIVGNTPWILLTRGDTFDIFKRKLEDAIQAGAAGFLAGRALWQEVCQLEGSEKEKFLAETLPERFKVIAKIAQIG